MNALHALRQAGGALLSLLYPPHCAMCGADVEPGKFLCCACLGGARQIRAPFCEKCSEPFDGAITTVFSCSNCGERRLYFENAVACHLSRGVVRNTVIRFKYGHEFYLRRPLFDWLAEGLEDSRIASRPFDFIVPVPLHYARERERGFNQAKVLAKMLSKRTGRPLLDCLRRIRKTPTQTKFDREERMENLLNAFKMRNNTSVQGKELILVDDVFTTGSTANECARTLKKAGAASVRVLTVARG